MQRTLELLANYNGLVSPACGKLNFQNTYLSFGSYFKQMPLTQCLCAEINQTVML